MYISFSVSSIRKALKTWHTGSYCTIIINWLISFATVIALFTPVSFLFLQQRKPYENEIHWIILYNYHSKITDIHLNSAVWFLSVNFLFLFFFVIIRTIYQLNNCAFNEEKLWVFIKGSTRHTSIVFRQN